MSLVIEAVVAVETPSGTTRHLEAFQIGQVLQMREALLLVGMILMMCRVRVAVQSRRMNRDEVVSVRNDRSLMLAPLIM
jgi:hypothetical protein